MNKLRLQFINANAVSSAQLKIDIEKRDIVALVRAAMDHFDAPAARIGEVIGALRDNRPDIVHFSAHGSPSKEIVLYDSRDEPAGIDRDALQKLFALHKENIRLVVLNACYSEKQALAIGQYIDWVIGVNGTIGDDVALRYSLQLYGALASGASVKTAHEEALIALEADHVPPEQWPRLFTRAGAESAAPWPPISAAGAPAPRPQPPEYSEFRRKRRMQYEQDRDRCGVHAESFTLTKYSDVNGNSELVYEVGGLTVDDDSVIEGLYFSVESEAGFVNDPMVDSRAIDLAIDWVPKPSPEPQSLDDVIDTVKSASGMFCFRQKLTGRTGPYTFGWTVRVRNMDAVTLWEFENLYVTEERRRHVDESPLRPPQEYMARLVWFPTALLVIRVQLPEGMPAPPRLRYFEPLKDARIPRDEILSGGVLSSFPREGSKWRGEGAPRWEPRLEAQRMESVGLRDDGKGGAELTVAHPALGSWYSLDWQLQDPRLFGQAFRFKSEAEQIRIRLLELRKHPSVGSQANGASDPVSALFKSLHLSLWERFKSGVDDEIFETALMTYDAERRRMVLAQGLVNDGVPWRERAGRPFELPFGMGLAGACFRSGDGALTYAKSRDKRDPTQPDSYLHTPGSVHHEYLIALPIDHPDLTREMAQRKDVQRCRQLIGVMTIGSDYAPSALQEFCVDPPTERPEYKQWREKLQLLRDECQRECDKLSLILLGKTRPIAPGSQL